MNRRSFITSMLAACAAPMALKGAGRTWKKVDSLLVPKYEYLCINPEWKDAPFEMVWYSNDPEQRAFFNQFPARRFKATGEEIPPFIFST